MSCNTCQAKFSFFTKEVGCPKCGFSYCSKCLKYKFSLPNIGERKICGRCFNKLQAQEKVPTRTDEFCIPDGLEEPLVPIDITKKMESLENPARPPIILYKQHSKLDKLGAGLDPIDQEIVNRLKKLKGEDKQLPRPTEDEIRRRLALLKDQDPDIASESVNIHHVDTRTTQQKTDDLIREYLERLEISKNDDKIDSDIQARLDNLRGIDSSKYPKERTTDFEEEEDEASQTKKIIEKALAEAALESKYEDLDELEDAEQPGPPNSNVKCLGCTGTVQCPQCFEDSHEYQDELDSCCMCEQTADLVVCKGCTGDLYCPVCFKDNHDDFEMHKHKTVPYKPRKHSSD